MGDFVIAPEAAEKLVVDILKCHDTRPENALSVARALVAAEIDAQPGHGLSRVPFYAAQSASGKVDGRANPSLADHKNGAFRIDAANGFAYPALDLAIAKLASSGADFGVTAATIFRSHHFGQAGYHAERLANRGLVALVLGNSSSAIAPWGGNRGLFGTNPIGFAAPVQGDTPLVIDLSLSKVARGKVMLARQRGESIPEGWALDETGQPTVEPEAALKGTMLPMGAAKGAALVLTVEMLAAAMSGANFGYEASSFFTAEGAPPGVGQTIVAFDPGFFSGGSFPDRMDALLAAILSQDNVRLPGSRKKEYRAKAVEEGIAVPAQLMAELQRLRTR